MDVIVPTPFEVETFELDEEKSKENLELEQIRRIQSLHSTVSITKASVSRAQVPLVSVAEEIKPGQKLFTTPLEVVDCFQEAPNPKEAKSRSKRNFLVNLFTSRNKKKGNVNNNSLSFSDIVSAVKNSGSHKTAVGCCC